jgi:shikimate dehydrogenase
MHMAAFAALGMHGWRYQRLPVPPELFVETVRALGKTGFVGASVTIPHKRAALALADEASEAASEIGAANTLTLRDHGAIEAENTDAPGLIAAIEDGLASAQPPQPRLQELSVLVLGAGGSARAAVWGLRRAGVADVAVWNRTPARAEALVRELGGRTLRKPAGAGVLINCTAVGLEQGPRAPGDGEPSLAGAVANEARALDQLELSPDQLPQFTYVVDLVYRRGETPLLAAAARLGVPTLDGLEILVRQGALSFQLWTGANPPLEAMRAGARGEAPGGRAL